VSFKSEKSISLKKEDEQDEQDKEEDEKNGLSC
jgi:hypothetical protein